MNFKTLLLILIGFLLLSCKKEPSSKKDKQNKILVLNIGDIENFNNVKDLKLDSIYLNLLNRETVTDSVRKNIFNSWSNFHDKLDDLIKKENFEWETDSLDVKVFHKVYFTKDGEIEYYLYNIKSEFVSLEKKAEFDELIKKFIPNVKFEIKRKEKYSQCGTNVYKY